MREITRLAVAAFQAGEHFRLDNTEVRTTDRPGEVCVELLLHDSVIARRWTRTDETDETVTEVTTAGWDTVTTRERLNGIPGVRVNRSKGDLYLNGSKWDGDWRCLCEGCASEWEVRS